LKTFQTQYSRAPGTGRHIHTAFAVRSLGWLAKARFRRMPGKLRFLSEIAAFAQWRFRQERDAGLAAALFR